MTEREIFKWFFLYPLVLSLILVLSYVILILLSKVKFYFYRKKRERNNLKLLESGRLKYIRTDRYSYLTWLEIYRKLLILTLIQTIKMRINELKKQPYIGVKIEVINLPETEERQTEEQT